MKFPHFYWLDINLATILRNIRIYEPLDNAMPVTRIVKPVEPLSPTRQTIEHQIRK